MLDLEEEEGKGFVPQKSKLNKADSKSITPLAAAGADLEMQES